MDFDKTQEGAEYYIKVRVHCKNRYPEGTELVRCDCYSYDPMVESFCDTIEVCPEVLTERSVIEVAYNKEEAKARIDAVVESSIAEASRAIFCGDNI